jgi:hypothetical protein
VGDFLLKILTHLLSHRENDLQNFVRGKNCMGVLGLGLVKRHMMGEMMNDHLLRIYEVLR